MMLKQLRKKLDLSWIKKNRIWDVVVYGSYARGKIGARDIDVALILEKKVSVKIKMDLSQKLRNMLKQEGLVFDVKAIDWNDFLDEGFLGRESILAEGYSILKQDYLAERFGFNAQAIVEYSLRDLTLSGQKMLYYALQGRKKGEGILSKLNGRIVSKGVLQVPTRHYEEIKSVLEQHGVIFIVNFVLQYRYLQ